MGCQLKSISEVSNNQLNYWNDQKMVGIIANVSDIEAWNALSIQGSLAYQNGNCWTITAIVPETAIDFLKQKNFVTDLTIARKIHQANLNSMQSVRDSSICKYRYTYGTGNQPNREIHFLRTENYPSMIEAHVFALNQDNKSIEKICTVSGDYITVDPWSTSLKAQAMMRERITGIRQKRPVYKSLSKMTIEESNAVLRSLSPKGKKKIKVESEPNGYFERVVKINIFDPS